MIISIFSRKGGDKKTTTAAHIAHGLRRRGHRVLIVDLDQNGHAAITFGLDQAPGIAAWLNSVFEWFPSGLKTNDFIRPTGRPGLDILPGNDKTTNVLDNLSKEPTYLHRTIEAIKTLALPFDDVVIDTPPAGVLQEAAVAVASHIIAVVRCEVLSYVCLADTMSVIGQLATTNQIAILPTDFVASQTEHQQYYTAIGTMYNNMVATPVMRTVAVPRSQGAGLTCYETSYDHSASVTLAYDRMIDWLIGE